MFGGNQQPGGDDDDVVAQRSITPVTGRQRFKFDMKANPREKKSLAIWIHAMPLYMGREREGA